MLGNPDILVDSHIYHQHNLSSKLAPTVKGAVIDKESLGVPVSSELFRSPNIPEWNFKLKEKLLIVEGNIGIGKTTLAKKLAKALDYRIFLEPTTENPYLGEE